MKGLIYLHTHTREWEWAVCCQLCCPSGRSRRPASPPKKSNSLASQNPGIWLGFNFRIQYLDLPLQQFYPRVFFPTFGTPRIPKLCQLTKKELLQDQHDSGLHINPGQGQNTVSHEVAQCSGHLLTGLPSGNKLP